MYALVIGASRESIFAIQQAQSMGMIVLGFDEDKNALGLKYVDEAFVVDIRNPQNIYDIIEQKGIKSNELVVLPVPVGRCLTTTGAVNEYYNLVGVKGKCADLCTDKYAFHQVLKKNNLRNIQCNLLKEGTKPKEFPHIPVIVKPRYGSGSRAVELISNMEEWQKFVDNAPYKEDFIVEEAVSGEEYGMDAMVIDGKFHLVLLRKKIITEPPIRQCVGYISVVENESNSEMINKMTDYVQEIVNVIDVRDGIMHVDIIFNDGMPFIIELSVRPSGHMLHNIFTPKVAGINMVKEFLMYAMNGKCIVPRAKKNQKIYMIHYFNVSDCYIKQIPNEIELRKKFPLEEYVCNLKCGFVSKVVDGHSLMDRGYFILGGESEGELIKYSKEIINLFIE